MSRVRVRRWAALLLFACLGTEFGLPGLDAWLYHREPTTGLLAPIHVDAPGGCDSHAERCIAAATVGAPRLTMSAPPPPLPRLAPIAGTPPALASRPRKSDLHTLQQPRAPPTHLS
jgi:hypothetical protein